MARKYLGVAAVVPQDLIKKSELDAAVALAGNYKFTVDDTAPSTPKFGDWWMRPADGIAQVYVAVVGGGGTWFNPFGASVSDPSKANIAGDAFTGPITGTSASFSGLLTGVYNYGAFVNIASASTMTLLDTANVFNVTGTTTINSLGSTVAVGGKRWLIFGGILTLTHNATSLILKGTTNIVTAAGDVAEMISLGGGNWKMIGYLRASTAIDGGATGGSTDRVFYENDQIITAPYTVKAGKNAGSFGPLTIADGVTVTIETGAVWSIV